MMMSARPRLGSISTAWFTHPLSFPMSSRNAVSHMDMFELASLMPGMWPSGPTGGQGPNAGVQEWRRPTSRKSDVAKPAAQQGIPHDIDTAADAEFLCGVALVTFDCLDAEVQPGGDLFVAVTPRHQF